MVDKDVVYVALSQTALCVLRQVLWLDMPIDHQYVNPQSVDREVVVVLEPVRIVQRPPGIGRWRT